MQAIVKINCDNDAFEENPGGEFAAILRALANRIEGQPHFSPGHSQPLRDANGNRVGYLDVYEEEHVSVLRDSLEGRR